MCVYGFLCFPGGEIPFPKPRFDLDGQSLHLLNVPLPRPESLFEKRFIWDLPFIEYDTSYSQSSDWDQRFHHRLYSIRYLLARFPRWPMPRRSVTDEAVREINGEILRSFIQLAQEKGSIPIVVYFPSSARDFVPRSDGEIGIAKQVLRASGIPYLDMTDCVSRMSPAERFVRLHYSPVTNAAVAKCLRDSIAEGSEARERG